MEPIARDKYIWEAHPENEMVFFLETKFTSMGVRAQEVYQMSRKERLLRKKYIGVCKWKSRMVMEIRTVLPSKVVRYISRQNKYDYLDFGIVGKSQEDKNCSSCPICLKHFII